MVRHLEGLLVFADTGIGRLLLCCDGELLILELDERDSLDLDITDFFEALEPLEDGREIALLGLVGNILHKEGLVRSYIFVGDQGGDTGLRARFLCCRGGVGLSLRVLLRTFEVYSLSVTARIEREI